METASGADHTLGVFEAYDRLQALQKPNHGAPPYSRWVNRPLGRIIASLLSKTPVTPNSVTILSLCSTTAALTLLATRPPTPLLGVLLGGLLALGYALDSADGQLARLRGGGSLRGEWLDHVVDVYKVTALHGCVLVSFHRFTDAPAVVLGSALAYQVVAVVMFFGMVLIDQFRRAHPEPTVITAPNHTPSHSLLRTILASPSDYGLLCLAFLVIGWQPLFQGVYVLFLILNAVILAYALTRWWGQLDHLDRTHP